MSFFFSPAMIVMTSSSSPRRTSHSKMTASASAAPAQAPSTIASSSLRCGLKMPGVSTKMIWLSPSITMARDARPRRLHLVRNDRDLGAGQRIDQRRLAGIGRADDGAETAACWRHRSFADLFAAQKGFAPQAVRRCASIARWRRLRKGPRPMTPMVKCGE